MPVDVDAVVVSNSLLSSSYNVLALAAPEVASRARPGQFVMVKPSKGNNTLLRRPFSVFEVLQDDNQRITGMSLLNKQVGITTRALFQLSRGEHVQCLGPLGRPFSVAKSPERAWMVAGGVGLAPFYTLAAALLKRGVDSTLFYGGRSSSDLFHLQAFRNLGVRLELATEDGSKGHHGKITVPLEQALSRLDQTTPVRLYACGPTPMMRAVTELASSHGRTAEVSLEQVMGCGLGGCYSCVAPIRLENGGFHFVRSCLDGPVFDGLQVAWNELRA